VAIDGLTIGEWRSTDCRLPIDVSIVDYSSITIRNRQPAFRRSAIDNRHRDRQSPIDIRH